MVFRLPGALSPGDFPSHFSFSSYSFYMQLSHGFPSRLGTLILTL